MLTFKRSNDRPNCVYRVEFDCYLLILSKRKKKTTDQH